MAGLVVPGEMVGFGLYWGQKLVKVLGFGAWSLM